jgi:hypothetical protein
VPALVLAVGIAAGGYFMGGSGATADASAERRCRVDPALEPGEVIELEAVTVNLANGRFLRVGVAFLTSDEFESLAGKKAPSSIPSTRAGCGTSSSPCSPVGTCRRSPEPTTSRP